jgi:hypothetical protein
MTKIETGKIYRFGVINSMGWCRVPYEIDGKKVFLNVRGECFFTFIENYDLLNTGGIVIGKVEKIKQVGGYYDIDLCDDKHLKYIPR